MKQIGEQAVVLGAGMAGLLAARVLADAYERVTVVERDPLPETLSNRKGVPQGRHAHLLVPRGAQILGELFPGLLDDLAAGGAPVIGDYAELRFAPVVPDREPLLEREGPLRERAEAAGFERNEVAAFERDELLRDDPPPERDEALDLVVGLARPLAPFVERFWLCPLREVDLLLLAIPNPFSSQVTRPIRVPIGGRMNPFAGVFPRRSFDRPSPASGFVRRPPARAGVARGAGF